MSTADSKDTTSHIQPGTRQPRRSWFTYWELLTAIPCDAAGLLAFYFALMMLLFGWSWEQSAFTRAAMLYLAFPACAGLCCFGISAWLRRHATQRGFKGTRGSKIASMLCVVLLVMLAFFAVAILLRS